MSQLNVSGARHYCECLADMQGLFPISNMCRLNQ